jgi:hypothetical protein
MAVYRRVGENNLRTLVSRIGGFFWRNFDYLLIFLMAILMTAPILYCNFRSSGAVFLAADHPFHYVRAHSFSAGLKDGQFIPQLDPDMFFGFGYAFNEFYGPLPTYFIAFFKLFCGTYTGGVAIYELLMVFLLGIFAYNLAGHHLVKNKTRRFNAPCLFMVVIFYASICLIPYAIYFILGYGSITAVAFFVLLVDGVLKLLKKQGGVFSIVIGGSMMILSHTLTAFSAVIFGLLFLLINIKKVLNKYVLTRLGTSAFGILGLTAFFIFPLLENVRSAAFNMSEPIFNKMYWWHTAEVMNQGRIHFFAPENTQIRIIIIIVLFILIFEVIRRIIKNRRGGGIILSI